MLQKRMQEDKCPIYETAPLEKIAFDWITKGAIILGVGIGLYLVLKVLNNGSPSP
jgi:hypothetical protein